MLIVRCPTHSARDRDNEPIGALTDVPVCRRWAHCADVAKNFFAVAEVVRIWREGRKFYLEMIVIVKAEADAWNANSRSLHDSLLPSSPAIGDMSSQRTTI